MELVHTVKRPPINFLRRKRPCEAYRDFQIDLSGQKKLAAWQMQLIQQHIQELAEIREYIKVQREHQRKYNNLFLDSDDDSSEDSEELARKITEFFQNDSQNEVIV